MDFPQRKVIRKKGYDYTSEGAYFITICTKDREQYFGKIKDGEMILNELGKYTWECRKSISDHFEFVEIGEFICMPDHIHGILIIKPSLKPQSGIIVGTDYHPSDLETQKISSDEQIQKTGSGKHILNDLDRTKNISSLHGSISGSLGSIIRGFKIGVIKFAKNKNIQFLWQSRFYDRIIKDEQEFQTIKKYIQDNPKNREKNENYL